MMGGDVYGFEAIWQDMLMLGEIPSNAKELVLWLDGYQYPEGQIQAEPHMLQTATDDDELDLAVLMFDDHYGAKHPDRVAFPLWEQQTLPDTVASDPGTFRWRGPVNDLSPRGRGQGEVYLVFIVIHDTGWLMDLYGAFRIRGLRLPEFASYLQNERPQLVEQSRWEAWISSGDWPDELRLLRWAALESSPGASLESILGKADSWHPHSCVRQMYESNRPDRFLLDDWESCQRQWQRVEARRKQDRYRLDDARRPTFIQAAPHLAQLSFGYETDDPNDDMNTQWFLFDDLWAASHPDMAKSLLHWASKQLPL